MVLLHDVRVEARALPPCDPRMTPFERVARGFIASRGSAGTRELYTYDLDRWLAFCVAHKINVAEPTPSQAAAFRDQLTTTQKPQTLRRSLAALSRMYRAALAVRPQAAKWNPFDPDALARPPAADFSKTEAVPTADVQKVMSQVARDPVFGVRDSAILQILYDTGLRISAVTRLERSKVFERDGVLVARVRTKYKDEVDVELTVEAAAALERWLAVAPESPYAFPASKNVRRPLGSRVFYKRLRAYGDAVGVPHLHPHRFRTTYITEALDAGVPLNEVQASVHHSTPTMTQRYDRGTRGRGVTAAVAKFRQERKNEH